MNRKLIHIQQGATFDYAFSVLDEVAGELVPKDLTGWSARMQVRESFSSPTAVLSLETGSGISIETANGRVVLTASPQQTAAIPAPKAYLYDIEGVRASDGRVERWLEGVARVSAEVTR